MHEWTVGEDEDEEWKWWWRTKKRKKKDGGREKFEGKWKVKNRKSGEIRKVVGGGDGCGICAVPFD